MINWGNFKLPSLRHLEVMLRLSWFNIKKEFSLTHAGFLWWIIEPLILMLLYYLLFGIILNIQTENFLVFILAGIIIWRWMQISIVQASTAMRSYKSLNSQFYVPKIIFPLQTVIINTCKYGVALSVLLIIVFYTQPPNPSHILIHVGIFTVQLLFTVACALLLSVLVSFIPDVRNILSFVFRGLFYISGVLFDVTRLPEKLQFYLQLNPFSVLIESQRNLLLYDQIPSVMPLLWILFGSSIALLLGIYLYNRFDKYFAKYI